MNNTAGLTEVALSVFGGINSELDPTDVPQGLSPDCFDVAFEPGSVFTRPPRQRYVSIVGAEIVYHHSYIKPNGETILLLFDSEGRIYANGSQIGQTQAGNRFYARNALGKCFIATSDGLHGTDVPLQYDGTNLDRVSQDGPGGAPSLANYSLPAVALVAGTSSTAVPITNITPTDQEQVQTGDSDYDYGGGYQPPTFETYYTSLLVTTSAPHNLTSNQSVSISGDSAWNYSGYVSYVVSPTQFAVPYQTQSNTVGTGGTVTASAPFLQRSGNSVQAATAAPHGLRPGMRVSISGVADQAIGGGVTNIKIDNTAHPGLAEVTTAQPSGLSPGQSFTLTGVANVAVGGGIVNTYGANNTNTVTMNTPHGLQVGASVTIQSGSGPYLTFQVTAVSSPTTFSYYFQGASGTQTGGTVTLVWPGNENTTQQFTVDSLESATKFYIPLDYSNGTWTSGTITYAWNGTYYVTATPTPTTLTYKQAGPDLILTAGSGVVTPEGQIAPGQRGCVCIFQTRTGYLTRPSPSVTITANGSQSLTVSNVPIGPPNTVARILAFTGAGGATYFYLPIAPPDPTGTYLLGTSTVIRDNTTTTAVFDFADESLFDATSIDSPGNNLFNLEVLGPCLGFFSYGSRLMSWGDRNRIQQFYNMGFEGGTYASDPNTPLGWIVSGSGTLASGDYGMGWQFGDGSSISQTAYQDRFGRAILKPLTPYSFRLWLQGTGSVTVSLVSQTAGTLATATIQSSAAGAWAEAPLNAQTPVAIPSDTLLTISGTSGVTIDELELIYSRNPFRLNVRGSYIRNGESFDGVTGNFGPVDSHPVIGMEERRDILSLLTAGPDGSRYEAENTASGEPSAWNVRHVASKCGLTSVWGIAKFEDWFCWTSDTGLRIDSESEKLSQEIQKWWDTHNPAAKQFTVLANDPYTRRLYVAAAVGDSTAINSMYVLDYRELNTAGLLANAGTLKISGSGRVITSDLTRKWSPWSIVANHVGQISLPSGGAVMGFAGEALYTLKEGDLGGIDADYGPFWATSYYTTYFLMSQEEAQQYRLSPHRLLHGFLSLNITGNGQVYVTPLLNRLSNEKRTLQSVTISPDLARDVEKAVNVSGERVAYRIACQPLGPQPAPPELQAGFKISSMVVGVRDDPYAPIRGKNG